MTIPLSVLLATDGFIKGSGGGGVEAARARVRCAWAKF